MTEQEFLIHVKQSQEAISRIIFGFEMATRTKINDIIIQPHENIKEEGGFRNITIIGIKIDCA